MSVYKPKNSPFYHYDFQFRGARFCGSTEKAERRAAEAVERAKKEEVKESARSGAAAEKHLTIAAAVKRYWEEVGQHHANSDTTMTDLERLQTYFGATTRLADIDDEKVASLVQWRRAHPRWDRENDPEEPPAPRVSPSTVNRSTTLVLKKLFTRAKRTWRYTFPLEPIWKDHFLEEPDERVRELRSDESAALTLATRPDYQPIFAFERATGLRLEECLLRWSEVDWTTGWITKRGKGKRLVRTAITSTVREILEPLIGHHEEWVFTYEAKRAKAADTAYKGDGSPRERGARYPITYSGFKSQWKRIRAAAGVKDFRFHDFRHDVATKLLRDTGNLKIVQKALNHRDLKTTTRYAHVLDEDIAEAMEALASRTQKPAVKSRTKSRKNS